MTERGRRREILTVARELFREKGYHATTIRDIADGAGLLSGSLYAHIRTKEDLLFEITDEIADRFLTGIRRIAQDAALTPVEKFHAALCEHIRVVADNMDAATVFSHEWKALSDERKQRIQKKRDDYEQQWTFIIDDGVEQKVFQDKHRKFARMVTLSVANWLYQWYDPAGDLDAAGVAERLATVLLHGLEIRKEAF